MLLAMLFFFKACRVNSTSFGLSSTSRISIEFSTIICLHNSDCKSQIPDFKFARHLLLAVLRVTTKMDICSLASRIKIFASSLFLIPLSDRISSPVSYTHLRAHETRHDLV